MSDPAREYAAGRREFCRSTARWIALGGLVGGGAWLGLRRPGAKCVRRLPCDGCALLVDCQLPRAELARAIRPDSAQSSEAGHA
jgi:hypothetical protein